MDSMFKSMVIFILLQFYRFYSPVFCKYFLCEKLFAAGLPAIKQGQPFHQFRRGDQLQAADFQGRMGSSQER